jgi:hypothetical protein
MGKVRIVQSFGGENPKEKDLFGRPRHRCEDGIRMDLRDTACEDAEDSGQ